MGKTRNGEGSIRPRTTRQGTVYDVQLTVRNRRTGLSDRIFKGGFKTEKEAVQWRNATMRKSELEGVVRAKPVTVPEVVLAWINSDSTRAPSTESNHRGLYRNHILPRLNVRVPALTERALNEFLAATTPGTGVNVMIVLQASLRWASGRKVALIEGNPIDDMPRLLRPHAGRGKAMPPEAMARLFAASSGSLSGVLWRLLAATAARRGEILGLNWECVDLETGVVSIHQIASPETHGRNTAARTKGKREREICLPAYAVAALRGIAGGVGAGKEPIFKAPRGGRLGFTTVDKWWARDCAAAGVCDYTPHSLRHSWATMALEQRIPVNVVSSILGHANVSTTLNIYAHETKAQKASAVSEVADVFATYLTS